MRGLYTGKMFVRVRDVKKKEKEREERWKFQKGKKWGGEELFKPFFGLKLLGTEAEF